MTKSKVLNTFKVFFVALLLVPIAFVFAACGGQLDTKASVNTNGNYTASSKGDFKEALGKQTELASQTGYRFTTEMNLNGKINSSTVNSKMLLNGILAKDEMAMKISTNSLGENMSGEMYVKDNTLYTHSDAVWQNGINWQIESKTKQTITSMDSAFNDSVASMAGEMKDVQSFLELIDGDEYAVVTKSGTNYCVKVQDMEFGELCKLSNVKIYFNFDAQNKLIAVGLIADASMTTLSIYGQEIALTGTAAFTISAFEGQIQFPDFSGYTEA